MHSTSEHGVSSITTITTADAHTSAASRRLNWRPPADLNGLVRFARKTKSGFCACVITFQTCYTSYTVNLALPQDCAIDISYMSARPIARACGTTWLPLDRFSWNFILRSVCGGHKIRRGNSRLVQKRIKVTVTLHDVLYTFTGRLDPWILVLPWLPSTVVENDIMIDSNWYWSCAMCMMYSEGEESVQS